MSEQKVYIVVYTEPEGKRAGIKYALAYERHHSFMGDSEYQIMNLEEAKELVKKSKMQHYRKGKHEIREIIL